LADGGTIFLDEIGSVPTELQIKLLRVLQEGEFHRLGNPRSIKVDIRVIVATNRDLEKEVEDGRFREDLYYRLNIFPVKIPPLRERREYIPLLVDHFIKKYGAKFRRKIEIIPQKVMDSLQAYHWPGNIRDIVERAVIVSQGHQLKLGDWLHRGEVLADSSKVLRLEDCEKEHILEVLEMTGWRIMGEKGAAKILGLKDQTLASKMRKLGIKRPK
jgi:transcriptional regulator with GAF, ATPase, and Fis domain